MSVHRIRIVDRNVRGALIDWQGVADDADIFLSTAPGSGQMAGEDISVTARTLIAALDIPILSDADDDAGIYLKLGPTASSWKGAQAFEKLPLSYHQVGLVNLPSMLGVALTALPDYVGVNRFDESSSVDVLVQTGVALSSVSAQAVLGGSNHFSIGAEIVGARVATLIAAGMYRLTGLLRYRRGTQDAAGTHRLGERVIALERAGLLRADADIKTIGQTKTYVAVSNGKKVDDLDKAAITKQPRGLLPFSPIHLNSGVTGDSDVLMTWKRRTRLAVQLRGHIDVPLGEESELYELQVAGDTSFSNPFRHFFALRNPRFRYLDSDRYRDETLFGLPRPFYWRVAQDSPTLAKATGAQGTGTWSAAALIDLPTASLPVLATVLQINTAGADGTTAFTDTSSYGATVVSNGTPLPRILSNRVAFAGDPSGAYLSVQNDAAFNWRSRDFRIKFKFKTKSNGLNNTFMSRASSGFGPGSWILLINHAPFAQGQVAFFAADYRSTIDQQDALVIDNLPLLAPGSPLFALYGWTTLIDDVERELVLSREGSNFSILIDGKGIASAQNVDLVFSDCSSPLAIGVDLNNKATGYSGSIAAIEIARA